MGTINFNCSFHASALALYTIIEKDIQENEFEYSDELKSELDNRYSEYKNGTAEMITAAESKKRIEKILKAGTNK